jgi:hypothetical protein
MLSGMLLVRRMPATPAARRRLRPRARWYREAPLATGPRTHPPPLSLCHCSKFCYPAFSSVGSLPFVPQVADNPCTKYAPQTHTSPLVLRPSRAAARSARFCVHLTPGPRAADHRWSAAQHQWNSRVMPSKPMKSPAIPEDKSNESQS